ncbi:4'-phosphopantetheinyl transferase HetI [Anabaena subtropica]|uniref:4'-phosphopantetheinyl transferase superfamily protein n=1 Tax=Anabaena subtropica FACHB-260 TaxID=2692884 RepID=A0ABR8CQ86_9NOST|nr:4'-phosphopantetheinyl transferase HetI [Anabaena subtropica]MBD2344728.1 4'-phosphopantetheinyl transferase superfamily protein [Anabaena subtropica FACHB-260]
MFQHTWLPQPTNLTLFPDEVHLWRIHLDQPESQLQHLGATLSSDELARANRFYFPEHRQRFTAGRGILRSILGRYLGVEARQVKFEYESRGKPILADNQTGLLFNLSHSQDLALCAVNYTRQIGIDLEYLRPTSDLESLAKRFFLPREYELVRSLPDEQKQKIFFRYWTCKEAYLKATGDGIAKLEEIEIALTPTEPAKLQTSPAWSLLELVPDDNCVAAVAVAGFGWQPKFWQY